LSLAKDSAIDEALSLRSAGTRIATRGTGVEPDSTTMRCVAKVSLFTFQGAVRREEGVRKTTKEEEEE